MRANGAIGAALEAEITIAASEEQAARWQPLADELRFLFISGDVQVRPATTDEVFVSAQPTTKASACAAGTTAPTSAATPTIRNCAAAA